MGEAAQSSALKSALNAELQQRLATTDLLLLLDYDGTLAPIVNEPELAFISDETRAVLRTLAGKRPIGIISGRSNERLRTFLQLDQLYLAGSHGIDICGPASEVINGPDPVAMVGQPAITALAMAREALDNALSGIPGYLTENNVYCISAHYRMVDPAAHERVREAVLSVLQAQPTLRHKEGKMVHEVRSHDALGVF